MTKRPPQPALVDQVSPALQAARQRWMRGDHEGALQRFEAVVGEEPNNVRPLLDLSRAYFARYDFAQGETCLARLQQLDPAFPGVHHLVGDTYALLKLPGKAREAYATAAALPGVHPSTWVELAGQLERMHELDEAEAWLERSLNQMPAFPPALLLRARLHRRRGNSQAAAQSLEQLLRNVSPQSDVAAQAHAEWAVIHDRSGDYGRAWRAMEKSKAIHAARAADDRRASEKVLADYQQLCTEVTLEDARDWRQAAPQEDTLLPGLLAGFPRSGTTLLENILDAHPEVVCSDERDFAAKELFPRWQRSGGTTRSLCAALRSVKSLDCQQGQRQYRNVMEWYLGEPLRGRRHIDKNPHYTMTIPGFFRLFGDLKVLLAVRDPRDVVLSCFMTYLPLNPVSVQFLSVASVARRYVLDLQARRRWQSIWGASMHVVRYEDIVDDWEATARDVFAFLDVGWSPEVATYRDRLCRQSQTGDGLPQKAVTSPTYADVAQPVHRKAVGRWKNYENLMKPALEILEPYLPELEYDC